MIRLRLAVAQRTIGCCKAFRAGELLHYVYVIAHVRVQMCWMQIPCDVHAFWLNDTD